MVATRATTSPILSPEQVGELLLKPLAADSVAMQVSNVVYTSASSYRIPILVSDAEAGFVLEGEEIIPGEVEFGDYAIDFKKLGDVILITREAAADTSPQAAETIGNGFERSFKKKIDRAFFGTALPKGPGSLAGITGFHPVSAPAAFANLDPFAEASSLAEQDGNSIGFFVTNPATALQLAQIKAGSGSNVPLLATDPAQPARRLLNGVPLLVSPYVPLKKTWGIPSGSAGTHVVVREDFIIESSKEQFFTRDTIALKGIMRFGFGFPYPECIVKITNSAS